MPRTRECTQVLFTPCGKNFSGKQQGKQQILQDNKSQTVKHYKSDRYVIGMIVFISVSTSMSQNLSFLKKYNMIKNDHDING